MTIAGEAMFFDSFSDQKLSPKCSTPLHSATAIRRGHCSRDGRLRKAASKTASSPRRSAVNNSGGNSSSASFEARKLPAQARQISETSSRSRAPKPPRASAANADPAIELVQRPHRADQQIDQVGEETRALALVDVADELANPRDHEHADAQSEKEAHAVVRGDELVEQHDAEEADEQAQRQFF